ncbi:SPT2-domain-containing protein [Fomitiporia mediterranea MF3/22]|uniref:SPT2-domain-containing protein n=1 Tax=Fomitiporia mediterranea (strain MF3/22) TaxID=694068 RepID=UPI0004409701|nr:SPT2-domain-containing protein [Fomitiporia mediterranea MF3/22]EJD06598.1 SPT2-domain-containing protein [Fomitiporia mediterranea MF3/22]
MSARFAELMAMSAAQTRDSAAATQQILEEKKRREEQRRKDQLEQEKRDRELRAMLVKKRLEEEQRAEERKRKAEEDRQRKEQVIRRREDEQRRNLIYGKERKSGWGSSAGGGGRGRKSRNGSDDDGDAATADAGSMLTREEKRQRRINADFSKNFASLRKAQPGSALQGFKKSSKITNAFDYSESLSTRPSEARNMSQAGSSTSDGVTSLRKQLAAMPPTFTKVGTTKRDTRTIDEIVTDARKKKAAKVLEGEEARQMGDWFGENKKKKSTSVHSLSPAPDARASESPRSRSKDRGLGSKPSASAAPQANGSSLQKEPRTKVTLIKPDANGSLSFSKTAKTSDSMPAKSTTAPKFNGAQSSKQAIVGKSNSLANKKRARSYSLSDDDSYDSLDDSPPPTKRRPAGSSGRNDLSSEIWKLFGKDRNQYMQNDVYSDEDDDMEADADALRREEMRSARLAKREDELAAEEEKRHEEEKRRRKKEKERRGY